MHVSYLHAHFDRGSLELLERDVQRVLNAPIEVLCETRTLCRNWSIVQGGRNGNRTPENVRYPQDQEVYVAFSADWCLAVFCNVSLVIIALNSVGL
jgi:hypothetical protein